MGTVRGRASAIRIIRLASDYHSMATVISDGASDHPGPSAIQSAKLNIMSITYRAAW